MNCTQAQLKLEGYLNHSLPPKESEELCGHLEGCLACQQVYSDELKLNRWVKQAFELQTIPLQPLREAIRARLDSPEAAQSHRLKRVWIPWALVGACLFTIIFGAWASHQYVQHEPLRLIINNHIAHERPESDLPPLEWKSTPEAIQSLFQAQSIPEFYLNLLPPETAHIRKATLCPIGQDQWLHVLYDWESYSCSFLIRSLPQISPEFLQVCPTERGRKNYRYRGHNLFTFAHGNHQIVFINDMDRELSDSLANQSQLRLIYQAPRPLAFNHQP